MGRKTDCLESEPDVDAFPSKYKLGKDLDLDYMMQFTSWKGFDTWLQSIQKREQRKRSRREGEHYEYSYIEPSLLDLAETVYDELPEPSSEINLNEPYETEKTILPLEEFNQIEQEMLNSLLNENLFDTKTRQDKQRSSRRRSGLRDSQGRSISSFKFESESRMSKFNAVETQKSQTKAGKKNTQKSKKSSQKGKKDKKEPKEPKQEEEVIEVPEVKRSLIDPDILDLFNQLDDKNQSYDLFLKSLTGMLFPQELQLVVVPPTIVIKDFVPGRTYKKAFTLINTSSDWLQCTMIKLLSINQYLYKIKGRVVSRIAPGGFNYFRVFFCSDEFKNSDAKLNYYIKRADQKMTQCQVQFTCIPIFQEPIYPIDSNEEMVFNKEKSTETMF